jgi:ParB family chromosome partitioning protein
MNAKVDRQALMRQSLARETETVVNRFAVADAVLEKRPAGLAAAPRIETKPSAPLPMASAKVSGEYAIGQTYVVPLGMLNETPFNARYFYTSDELDETTKSLVDNGQHVPLTGYVDSEKVVIIDGSKRLRAARAGGLTELRVEICVRPPSDKDIFLKSHQINETRSGHTVLDMAIRFDQMLINKHFATQEDLAIAIGRGMDQSRVSRIRNLVKIPEKLMWRMKDSPLLSNETAAIAISTIFKAEKFDGKPDEAVEFAYLIMDHITQHKIPSRQVESLIKSRLNPAKRERNESRPVHFAGVQGTIRSNPSKGEFTFVIKGLQGDKVEELRKRVEALCEATGA